MALVDKTIYYYLILFATFLFTVSFIPILFEIIQQKITSNIPYISIICMMVSFLIYLFITISRQYYFHLFFYSIGLISVTIIFLLKRKYDNNNITIQKSITNIIKSSNNS
jgi:uncharacterized protein with PQ loop repeat